MLPLPGYQSALGEHCINVGISKASKDFQVSYQVAKYWCLKQQNPNFHSGGRGGRRNVKFSPEDKYAVDRALWAAAKEHPCLTLLEYQTVLGEKGYNVNT